MLPTGTVSLSLGGGGREAKSLTSTSAHTHTHTHAETRRDEATPSHSGRTGSISISDWPRHHQQLLARRRVREPTKNRPRQLRRPTHPHGYRCGIHSSAIKNEDQPAGPRHRFINGCVGRCKSELVSAFRHRPTTRTDTKSKTSRSIAVRPDPASLEEDPCADFFFRFRSPPMNYASTGSAQTTPHADRAAQPLEPTATDATAATTPRKSMFVPPYPPPHLVGVCVCSSRCITKLDASLSDLSNKTQQNATANGCQQPPAPPRPTFSFSRSYDSVTSPVEAGRRKKETRKRCKYCDYETVSETGRLE